MEIALARPVDTALGDEKPDEKPDEARLIGLGHISLDTGCESFIRRDATEEEILECRHVADQLNMPIWVALVVGAAERFAFYAITTPWQNYLQNGRDDKENPGALGFGQATATNVYNAYYLFAALVSTPIAIVSDTKLGRFKTLAIALIVYILGSLAILFSSIPSALGRGAGIPGLVIAMVLIGCGVGGVKATINAFIGDQYNFYKAQVVRSRKGEIVVVDRTLTLQYIYNLFYWMTNIAALVLVPSTFLERLVGFWAAYLIGPAALCIALGLLIIYRKSFVILPASGNILPRVYEVLLCAARGKFKLSATDPAYQLEHFNRRVSWTSSFVTEIKCGLVACRVLTVFGIFYLCFNQLSNNLISQAGQMDLHGTPNDLIRVFNGISCVLCGPIIQKGLYPLLNRYKIPFRPLARITVAFLVMACAMAYAAGIQKLIYSSGPCYNYPLECEASRDGLVHNSVNVWIQVPLYFILAVAEILGFVAATEYSYSKAPKDMKALLQAFAQLMSGVGAALGIALSPTAKNPLLVWLYTSLAGVMLVSAFGFWILFGKYDAVDDELDAQQLQETSQ